MASTPAARALRAVMHHEKQEQGSMLCAQHALNALLQGSYYDPSQLADIAAQMDDLEHAELSDAEWEARGRDEGSLNVDATGFFSLGVMEAALGIWNLSLERWRSASMREFHDKPEEQDAFVLNLQQHWFTIRGFGRGWWFNLNSHISEPAWVGPSYLGALLDQCETEGYSVFVVRATGNPNPLRTSPADELARTLPSAAAASSGAIEPAEGHENESEEDAELQAALRASMAQAHIGGSAAEAGPSGSSRAADRSASGSGRQPHGTRRARSVELGSDDELRGGLGMGDSGPETDAHVDALAPSRQRARLLPQSLPHASGARSRRRASRARHGRDEQSGASRETAISLESDDDDSQDGTASAHRSPFLNPVLAGAALEDIEDLDDDDDDEIAFHSLENSDEERGDAAIPSGPRRDRTYDDEDADLQRALAASMRDAGGFEEDGFAFTSASRSQPERTPPPADVDRITKLRAEAKRQEAQAKEDAERRAQGLPTRAEEERKAASGKGADDSSDDDDDEPAEVLSPDEIRRRRLARFGA